MMIWRIINICSKERESRERQTGNILPTYCGVVVFALIRERERETKERESKVSGGAKGRKAEVKGREEGKKEEGKRRMKAREKNSPPCGSGLWFDYPFMCMCVLK